MNSNRRIVTPRWMSHPSPEASPVAPAPKKRPTRAEREAKWDEGAEQRSERRMEQAAEDRIYGTYD